MDRREEIAQWAAGQFANQMSRQDQRLTSGQHAMLFELIYNAIAQVERPPVALAAGDLTPEKLDQLRRFAEAAAEQSRGQSGEGSEKWEAYFTIHAEGMVVPASMPYPTSRSADVSTSAPDYGKAFTDFIAAFSPEEALRLLAKIGQLQAESAVMRFHARTHPPKLSGHEPAFIVLRQRELDPWEVSYFTERDDAVACFDYAGAQWVNTFLLVPIARAEKAEAERALAFKGLEGIASQGCGGDWDDGICIDHVERLDDSEVCDPCKAQIAYNTATGQRYEAP